jgi:hypothetical protein
MSRGRIACGTAAVALLIALGTLGCTQDEAISSGNARATFQAAVLSEPPPRWNTAVFQLDRAIVSAQDPDAAVNLGASPPQIDLIPEKVGFDLRIPTEQVFFETPLAPGRYLLETLYWFPPTLADPDADPNASTCIEKIDQIPPPPTTQVQVFAQPVPLAPPIEFSVPSGGVKRIAIEVDAAGLVADYESRWICIDDPNARCNQELSPCLIGWDSFGFQQAIPQYVTVRVE